MMLVMGLEVVREIEVSATPGGNMRLRDGNVDAIFNVYRLPSHSPLLKVIPHQFKQENDDPDHRFTIFLTQEKLKGK